MNENVPDKGQSYWFDLGDVAVVPLIEIDPLLIDSSEFFPGLALDPEAWCLGEPWVDEGTGKLVLVIQSFIICAKDEVTLVDACVGAGKNRKRPQFDHLAPVWMNQFLATGLRPEQVDSVIFTHLHTDHVGAATQLTGSGWEAVFPHAPHYVVESDYCYWISEDGASAMTRTGDYVDDSVRPIEQIGQIAFVEPDASITGHVQLEPAIGHTPGNICVRVTGSSGELLLAGDTMHHPIQVFSPATSTQYCFNPEQAAQVRRNILAESVSTGLVVVPSHFPRPTAGRIVASDAGLSFDFAVDIIRHGQFVYEEWKEEISNSV